VIEALSDARTPSASAARRIGKDSERIAAILRSGNATRVVAAMASSAVLRERSVHRIQAARTGMQRKPGGKKAGGAAAVPAKQ
jgi:hypothetical protein